MNWGAIFPGLILALLLFAFFLAGRLYEFRNGVHQELYRKLMKDLYHSRQREIRNRQMAQEPDPADWWKET